MGIDGLWYGRHLVRVAEWPGRLPDPRKRRTTVEWCVQKPGRADRHDREPPRCVSCSAYVLTTSSGREISEHLGLAPPGKSAPQPLTRVSPTMRIYVLIDYFVESLGGRAV